MKRIWVFLVVVILLAGLVPTALALPGSVVYSGLAADNSARAGTMAILDDFNRADGPIGPNWTVHDGFCDVSSNAAVCGSFGRATFNGAPGDGNVAEADIAVDGTSLQFAGLLLNYGAGVSNLFLKVQQQDGSGQFEYGGCYTGNNGASFGLGFFALAAPFSTAHMKATRVGSDVTIEFTNIDGGAQPPQSYVCTGAPAPEGTGIGILGWQGIARLDNFGLPGADPIAAWKEAPPVAAPGDVISYTLVISPGMLGPGMFMTDVLPLGVAYADNLAFNQGYAWYEPADNAVYWTSDLPRSVGAAPAPARTGTPADAADLATGQPEAAASPAQGPVPTFSYPEVVLWDNGPLVTHPGACGGQDASRLQGALGMATYGFGHQFLVGNRMADDFEITDPAGWGIDQIIFFAYQTDAPSNPSPITGVYYQIWDGPPDDPGSSVVFGDLVTNRLLSSTFTNIQRDWDSGTCPGARYIFADVASAGVLLPPGVYWIDWMTDGSLSSGPWAPPITILGQTTTGNALQYTTSSGAWNPANDDGTGTQQGMPFIIEGTIPAAEPVIITFDVTVTAGCGDLIVNEGVAGMPGVRVPFMATTRVCGDPGIEVTPPALAAELCPDSTADRDLLICNVGVCPLDWRIVEMSATLAGAPATPFQPVRVSGGSGAEVGLTLHSAGGTVGVPAAPANPEAVLWDQPLSTVNQAAYVDQEFPDYPDYSSFLADDFSNADPWAISTIFVPGDGWNGFTTLMSATALTWQIYADCAGIPCGDPSGGGSPPLRTLTLPPDHPAVVITTGTPGGYPSDTTLNLPAPLILLPGTWWLVFYPTMEFGADGQYGRQAADTTNGYVGQFINPGGDFGLGTAWQDWTILGPTQPDIAFRLEGEIGLPGVDIPWLSEAPITGTVIPGECQTVTVTFDATGLTPGDYFAKLVVYSNDSDKPEVAVPVTMTVPAPVDLVDFTWAPTSPFVGETTAFVATVGGGTPPFYYTWDYGDGGGSTGSATPSYAYAAAGTFTVTLTVTNTCGTLVTEHPIVVQPVGPTTLYVYLPIVYKGAP